MKKIKSFMIILLTLILSISLVACDNSAKTPDNVPDQETTAPDQNGTPDTEDNTAPPEDPDDPWPGYPTADPVEPSYVGDLILNRVVHADNNRKYVEITNIGDEPIDLSSYAFYTLKNGDHAGDYNATEEVSAVIPLPKADLAPGCSVYIKHQWKSYLNDMSDYLDNIEAIAPYVEGTATIDTPVLITGALQYNGKDTVELIKNPVFNADKTLKSYITMDYLYDSGAVTGSEDTFFVKKASYYRVYDKTTHRASWQAVADSQKDPQFQEIFNTVPER